MTDDYRKTVESLMSGMAAAAVSGYDRIILANVSSAPQRDVSAPETETVIFGPREAFTEALDTNVALIRRIMKSEKLRMKVWQIGSTVATEVRMLYMDGIAGDQVIKEISGRLDAIQPEAVFDSNYIAELIKDRAAQSVSDASINRTSGCGMRSANEGKGCRDLR